MCDFSYNFWETGSRAGDSSKFTAGWSLNLQHVVMRREARTGSCRANNEMNEKHNWESSRMWEPGSLWKNWWMCWIKGGWREQPRKTLLFHIHLQFGGCKRLLFSCPASILFFTMKQLLGIEISSGEMVDQTNNFKKQYGIPSRIPENFKRAVGGRLHFSGKDNMWPLTESCHGTRSSGEAIQTVPTVFKKGARDEAGK